MHLPMYFKSIQMDMSTINAVVVSGGGSMQSQYANVDGELIKTSEPMSYYVTQELLNYSAGTEVVAYGDEARLANVKGLFIRAKVDEMKAAQTKTITPMYTTPVQTPVAPTPAVAPAQAVAPEAPVNNTPVAPTPVATTPVQPTVQV